MQQQQHRKVKKPRELKLISRKSRQPHSWQEQHEDIASWQEQSWSEEQENKASWQWKHQEDTASWQGQSCWKQQEDTASWQKQSWWKQQQQEGTASWQERAGDNGHRGGSQPWSQVGLNHCGQSQKSYEWAEAGADKKRSRRCVQREQKKNAGKSDKMSTVYGVEEPSEALGELRQEGADLRRLVKVPEMTIQRLGEIRTSEPSLQVQEEVEFQRNSRALWAQSVHDWGIDPSWQYGQYCNGERVLRWLS